MTYSQIINIKNKLINIDYKFKIDPKIKFRFLTPDNLNGVIFKNQVKIETINNSESLDNNWYVFNEDIDFSILNKYRHIILQLYSETFINKQIEIFDDNDSNFYEIYRNNWFNCKDRGPTCGIQITNFLVEENKPIQEIDNLFKYKITGDATIIKNKYLKAGHFDSTIQLIGVKSNIVNFINVFELQPIDKENSKKTPKSINKVVDLIDNKVFPYFVSENNEINSINARIEMIKFQIKNYFIENNQEIDLMNKKILDEKDTNIQQKILIDNLDLEQKQTQILNTNKFDNVRSDVSKLNTDIIQSNLDFSDFKKESDKQIFDTNDKIDKKGDELNLKIAQNAYVISKADKKLIELEKTSESNVRNVEVIINTIEEINKKTKELSNDNLKLNTTDNRIINDISKLGEKLIEQTNKQNETRIKLFETIDSFETFTNYFNEKKNSLLWANKENLSYFEQSHSNVLNLQFYESTEKFIESRLYLIIDSTGVKLPYYSAQVKRITENICVARLLQLCSF